MGVGGILIPVLGDQIVNIRAPQAGDQGKWTCLSNMLKKRDQNIVIIGDRMKSDVSFLYFQKFRASLVAQWLRVCLTMQGTRVRALVWEDPTCHGATRPVSHSY